MYANRPLHPAAGVERLGKPCARVRSGSIRRRLRVPRLVDFVNLKDSAIGGPGGLAGVPFADMSPDRSEEHFGNGMAAFLPSCR